MTLINITLSFYKFVYPMLLIEGSAVQSLQRMWVQTCSCIDIKFIFVKLLNDFEWYHKEIIYFCSFQGKWNNRLTRGVYLAYIKKLESWPSVWLWSYCWAVLVYLILFQDWITYTSKLIDVDENILACSLHYCLILTVDFNTLLLENLHYGIID